MNLKTTVGHETVMLFAAAHVLFSTAVVVRAVWSGAPHVATAALVLSTIITMSIVMFTRTRLRRPAPVPVMAASRVMCQEVQPLVYDWKQY